MSFSCWWNLIIKKNFSIFHDHLTPQFQTVMHWNEFVKKMRLLKETSMTIELIIRFFYLNYTNFSLSLRPNTRLCGSGRVRAFYNFVPIIFATVSLYAWLIKLFFPCKACIVSTIQVLLWSALIAFIWLLEGDWHYYFFWRFFHKSINLIAFNGKKNSWKLSKIFSPQNQVKVYSKYT